MQRFVLQHNHVKEQLELGLRWGRSPSYRKNALYSRFFQDSPFQAVGRVPSPSWKQWNISIIISCCELKTAQAGRAGTKRQRASRPASRYRGRLSACEGGAQNKGPLKTYLGVIPLDPGFYTFLPFNGTHNEAESPKNQIDAPMTEQKSPVEPPGRPEARADEGGGQSQGVFQYRSLCPYQLPQ